MRHHWISNPAQWPGYATAARTPSTKEPHINMTVFTILHKKAENGSQRTQKAEQRWWNEGDDYQGKEHPSKVEEAPEKRFGRLWHSSIFIKRFVRIDGPNRFGIPQGQAPRYEGPKKRET